MKTVKMEMEVDVLQAFHALKEKTIEEYENIDGLLEKNEFDLARIKLFALMMTLNRLQEYYEILTGKEKQTERNCDKMK